jgi:hypothetical protein
MYYTGDTIYSYGQHFPMAKHVKDGNVLLTTQEYSVSTSRHLSHTRQACHHMNPIKVHNVMAHTKKDHLANIHDGFLRVARSMEKSKRARVYKDMYIRDAHSIMGDMERYAKLFLPRHKFDFTIEGCTESIAKVAERERKREARELKKRIAAEAERLEKWVKGDVVLVPFYNSPCRLRVRPSDYLSDTLEYDVVQTSLGATVPYLDAQRCFKFIMARRKKGWRRNGEQFPIGNFQLDAVGKDGIVAGCHRISWKEIERFSKQEGWTA